MWEKPWDSWFWIYNPEDGEQVVKENGKNKRIVANANIQYCRNTNYIFMWSLFETRNKLCVTDNVNIYDQQRFIWKSVTF